MRHMRTILTALCALASILFAVPALRAEAARQDLHERQTPAAGVDVYLFGTATCPHCAGARRFLDRLVAGLSSVRLRAFDLDGDGRHEAAFAALARHFAVDPPAVPLVIVGEQAFVGYRDDATSGADIERSIRACLAGGCADIASVIIAEAPAVPDAAVAPARRPELPQSIHLPWFGSIETRTLSLPALTILLGAVDGFNPCAMWVLVFLVGLLIGMNDPVRMWSYGAAFLVTSGLVYFAFMSAWLNLFLFLGALVWIRAAVGVFALGAGAYYLREFMRNREATCRVGSPGEKQRVMDRLRRVVTERSFLVAIGGIVTLAVAVNMIELLCSAGIPAVYTQVLALSGLDATAYYGYLALYIAVFMFDDAVIFVTAMITLQASGLAATYSRFSHLVGGAALLAVGLILILKPEWLAMA